MLDDAGGSDFKPDAGEIAAHMRSLAASLHLAPPRAYWPRHAYHFTELRNVRLILGQHALLSRSALAAASHSFFDTANNDIIRSTPYAHRFARLYFRPRTPMQYAIEGIRSQSTMSDRPHLPVPVFFLFDAPTLLSRTGVKFTDGNLAHSSHRIGSSADELKALPFNDIYGFGAYGRDVAEACRFHRQAEVLVEDRLPLTDLTAIVCRSGAERDTLLDLLGGQSPEYAARIRVADPREALFEDRGTHVKSVVWTDAGLQLRMRLYGGPFTYEYAITNPVSGHVLKSTRNTIEQMPAAPLIPFENRSLRSVRLLLRIDGHLAFSGIVTRDAILSV